MATAALTTAPPRVPLSVFAERFQRLTAAIKHGTVKDVSRVVSSYAGLLKDAGGNPRALAYTQSKAARVDQIDDDLKAVPVTVTTVSEDRDRDVVRPKGIRTANYANNPVVFWGHQEWEIPIARAAHPATDALAWKAYDDHADSVSFFDAADSDAMFIYGKIRRKMVSATSIAFVPIKAFKRDHDGGPSMMPPGWDFEEVDLTEYSWVGVPSNAEAFTNALRSEKGHISPRLLKGLVPYAAQPRGRCWSGWCPCPPCEEKGMKTTQKAARVSVDVSGWKPHQVSEFTDFLGEIGHGTSKEGNTVFVTETGDSEYQSDIYSDIAQARRRVGKSVRKLASAGDTYLVEVRDSSGAEIDGGPVMAASASAAWDAYLAANPSVRSRADRSRSRVYMIQATRAKSVQSLVSIKRSKKTHKASISNAQATSAAEAARSAAASFDADTDKSREAVRASRDTAQPGMGSQIARLHKAAAAAFRAAEAEYRQQAKNSAQQPPYELMQANECRDIAVLHDKAANIYSQAPGRNFEKDADSAGAGRNRERMDRKLAEGPASLGPKAELQRLAPAEYAAWEAAVREHYSQPSLTAMMENTRGQLGQAYEALRRAVQGKKGRRGMPKSLAKSALVRRKLKGDGCHCGGSCDECRAKAKAGTCHCADEDDGVEKAPSIDWDKPLKFRRGQAVVVDGRDGVIFDGPSLNVHYQVPVWAVNFGKTTNSFGLTVDDMRTVPEDKIRAKSAHYAAKSVKKGANAKLGKALNTNSGTEGGYLVPEEYIEEDDDMATTKKRTASRARTTKSPARRKAQDFKRGDKVVTTAGVEAVVQSAVPVGGNVYMYKVKLPDGRIIALNGYDLKLKNTKARKAVHKEDPEEEAAEHGVDVDVAAGAMEDSPGAFGGAETEEEETQEDAVIAAELAEGKAEVEDEDVVTKDDAPKPAYQIAFACDHLKALKDYIEGEDARVMELAKAEGFDSDTLSSPVMAYMKGELCAAIDEHVAKMGELFAEKYPDLDMEKLVAGDSPEQGRETAGEAELLQEMDADEDSVVEMEDEDDVEKDEEASPVVDEATQEILERYESPPDNKNKAWVITDGSRFWNESDREWTDRNNASEYASQDDANETVSDGTRSGQFGGGVRVVNKYRGRNSSKGTRWKNYRGCRLTCKAGRWSVRKADGSEGVDDLATEAEAKAAADEMVGAESKDATDVYSPSTMGGVAMGEDDAVEKGSGKKIVYISTQADFDRRDPAWDWESSGPAFYIVDPRGNIVSGPFHSESEAKNDEEYKSKKAEGAEELAPEKGDVGYSQSEQEGYAGYIIRLDRNGRYVVYRNGRPTTDFDPYFYSRNDAKRAIDAHGKGEDDSVEKDDDAAELAPEKGDELGGMDEEAMGSVQLKRGAKKAAPVRKHSTLFESAIKPQLEAAFFQLTGKRMS